MSYFDEASLVMIPSGYKEDKIYSIKPTDGSGDLTFSRSNDTATRVNSDGLIEKVRTNLLVQSQNLTTAAWSLIGTATRTANYGTAPDGTQTSTRIQYDGVSAFELFQYTGVATPVYGSIYIKGTAGQTLRFNGVDRTLTGGWQRIEGGLNPDGSNTYISIQGYSGLTALDYELWGAQAEQGDIATDYIATTSAAVSVGPVANLPRLDYLDSSCPKLLLEPQRTNLVTYSEQFDNAAWTKTAATVTANTATSPDGFTNSDTLEKVGGSGGLAFYYVVTSVTSNTTNTFSVFAKYKEGSGIIWLLGKNSGSFAYFNLQTGTALSATAGMTTKIEDYGNGWYRCSFTQDYTGASQYTFGVGLCLVDGAPNYDATSAATQGAYIYGAQFEAGDYATSYIPTLSAASTRGADAASKTGISSLIGQTEGTLFLDFVAQATTTAQSHIWLGAAGSEIGVYGPSTFTFYSSGGVSINGGAFVTGQRYKIAFAYKANDYVAYVNGVQKGTDTSATVPATSALYINSYSDFTETQKRDVNQALLFKTRLSNAELEALTTL